MPAEIIDKLYEIAQKGGYAGDQPARWEGGIAAITSAISHETPVLRDTVVDALDDLKTVAFEGGGGGGDLGALQSWPLIGDTAPEVDGYPPENALLAAGIDIGDTPVIGGSLDFHADNLAAGATMRFYAPTFTAAYIVTIDDDEVITAVESWDGVSAVPGEEDMYEFVMPTMQNTETAIDMIVIVGSQT